MAECEERAQGTPEDLEGGTAHRQPTGLVLKPWAPCWLRCVFDIQVQVAHQTVRNLFLESRREALAALWGVFSTGRIHGLWISFQVKTFLACLTDTEVA